MVKTLFYSDYLEGCHPEIMKRLLDTNSEQTPGYGKDRYCEEARDTIRKACGRMDADVHFLVGGTQTNATVIASVLRPYQGVVCAASGHINVHETGAIEHSGHKVLTLPSHNGKLDASELDRFVSGHFADESREHEVQPGMVYVSFSTELGTIYSRSELEALRRVCDRWNLPLYIDGARLGYGLSAEGCDLSLGDIASLSDVFYIGGTKQGALFGEAVVVLNEGLKKDFRYNIKQGGGMLAKGRLLGLQFLALFDDGLYLKIAAEADRKAMRMRDAFAAAGCEFLVDSPSNLQFPIIDRALAERLDRSGIGYEHWCDMPDGRVAARFCTSWATTESQLQQLLAVLEK